MNKLYRFWLMFCVLLLPALACSFPVSSVSGAKATPVLGVNSGGANNGGANPAPDSVTSTASPSPSPSPSPTASPTPTFTPTPDQSSSYLVKQIITLGGESVSGAVCNLGQPFDVAYATPKVNFVTHYIPTGAFKGNWTYSYSIASAGESHDAVGTYTLAPADPPGVLLLTMSGSDHVVFKGFDGKVPSRYQFNLVPASVKTCP